MNEDKLLEWGTIIEECILSDKLVSVFCEEKGFSRASYYKWRKKVVAEGLLSEERKKRGEPAYAEVSKEFYEVSSELCSEITVQEGYESYCPELVLQCNGWQILVGVGFDEFTLRRVMEVVENA